MTAAAAAPEVASSGPGTYAYVMNRHDDDAWPGAFLPQAYGLAHACLGVVVVYVRDPAFLPRGYFYSRVIYFLSSFLFFL